MSDDEWNAFVLVAPARTAKLAVARADGRPHVAPVWIDLETDGAAVFDTGADTLEGRHQRLTEGRRWTESSRVRI